MKLAFIASCFFATNDPIKLLQRSADHFAIPLRLYGCGLPHSGFVHTKVDALLPELEKLITEGFSHVLYTDGPDTFFVKGESEITKEYAASGNPKWIVGAESGPYPHQHLKIPIHMRYPCTGQYMGELEYIIEGWKALREKYHDGTDNEQGWMLRGISKNLLPDLRIDVGRTIFRAEADSWKPGDSGCALHFNGGYSDPVEGRWPRMLPIFERVFAPEMPCSV